MNGLAVFVKEPVPGKVKTRLVPAITKEQAAEFYKSWAKEIYEKVRALKFVNVQVAYDASDPRSDPSWLCPGEKVDFFFQSGKDLGTRMQNSFEKLFAQGAESVILIGSDSPGLPVGFIEAGFESLKTHDLILGPTSDGGYYLIGLGTNFPEDLFDGVAWSTHHVFEKTLSNAKRLGLRTGLLPEYWDIDRPEDLEAYQSSRLRP